MATWCIGFLPAGDPEKWQGAIDVLVGNSASLVNSIGELIEDAQVAAVKSKARTRGCGKAEGVGSCTTDGECGERGGGGGSMWEGRGGVYVGKG